ncbi:MAG TPA: PP2C family protein-serine/threonine phosphatase [Planctomycetota bacterium]
MSRAPFPSNLPAAVPLHSPAKDLYRRLDLLLGEQHRRARGQEFLVQALHALFSGFAAEIGAAGAQLFTRQGTVFESLARAGRLDAVGSSALALAGVEDELDSAAQRVHLLDPQDGAAPLAYFAIQHSEHPYVFLFAFERGWSRATAELVLATACSILAVRLLEERLGATMREAAEIQMSLLPARAPEFPGYDIAARSRPAEEVGGDWFDFLPLGEGTLGLSIGDASGHGLPAALMARDVVIGLRMGIEKELKATHALEKLNRVLHASTLSSCFASLLFGELEENGSFFYYNAGHDAPLLLDEGGCTLLRAGGTVLGPLPDARFRRTFAHVDHGALLVLYTDGIIERRARSGQLFGLERLQALLESERRLPAAALVEHVFAELDRFGEGGQKRDDETLVVVRRLG